jgi:nucleoside-diphosphate-sugar epimerase
VSDKVLVTGGSGFIGRALVLHLMAHGYDVTVLDRRVGTAVSKDSVRWIHSDTRDWDTLSQAVNGQDLVIHLAAGSSFLMYEEAPCSQTIGTIAGFQNVLEAARRYSVRKIVYASTSAVYEGNKLPYDESMPLNPPDLKAFAKKINEEMSQLYSQRYGIPLIGLRPLSVYGPEEVSKGPYANVVSLFAWAMLAGRQPIVWGDGSQTRDFTYVNDVVEAIRLALEADIPTQQLNVGTGIETSFNEVVATINEYLGTELTPTYVPVPVHVYARRLAGDPSLAAKVLGFRAAVTARDGIRRVIEAARPLVNGDQPGLPEMQERGREIAVGAQSAFDRP